MSVAASPISPIIPSGPVVGLRSWLRTASEMTAAKKTADSATMVPSTVQETRMYGSAFSRKSIRLPRIIATIPPMANAPCDWTFSSRKKRRRERRISRKPA